jgi:hypothetical protein
MDANARRVGGSRRRPLAIAAGVVALAAVVAIASSGSAPRGSVAERRPSEGLADTLVSLTLVVMALSTVAALVLMSFFGRYTGDGTRRRRRRSQRQAMLLFLGTVALIALAARLLAERGGDFGGIFDRSRPARTDSSAVPPSGYEPEFAVWPVVGVLTLVALSLAAWWLSARARRAALTAPPATPVEALADVLAATLDELRAERDPRRAVIRAYARMERSFAAVGLPRGEAAAPEEYVERVLDGVPISERAVERLTALFAWARFSTHDVRPETKDEAIQTLEHIQLELAAAEAERDARLQGVLA